MSRRSKAAAPRMPLPAEMLARLAAFKLATSAEARRVPAARAALRYLAALLKAYGQLPWPAAARRPPRKTQRRAANPYRPMTVTEMAEGVRVRFPVE